MMVARHHPSYRWDDEYLQCRSCRQPVDDLGPGGVCGECVKDLLLADAEALAARFDGDDDDRLA